MAGVKGRSGRKTRIWENAKASVIMQSWDTLQMFFNAKDISLEKKADIASRIAIKDMPTEFANPLEVTFTIKDLVNEAKNRQAARLGAVQGRVPAITVN